MAYNDDNPIDWSSFDEGSSAQIKLYESKTVKAVAFLVLVLGAVITVVSIADLLRVMGEVMQGGSDTTGAYILFAVHGAAGIIAACALLLIADHPRVAVLGVVMGVFGLLLNPFAAVVFSAIASLSIFTIVTAVLGVICAMLCVLASVRLMRVYRRKVGASASSARKEEIWNEDKIWQ